MQYEHELNNGTYPIQFVTVPDVEFHLSSTRYDTGAYVVAYLPSIESGQYGLWSQYVQENSNWLEESWENYARAEDHEHDHAEHDHATAGEISPVIWSVNFFDEDGDPYQYGTDSCYVEPGTSVHVDVEFVIEDPMVCCPEAFRKSRCCSSISSNSLTCSYRTVLGLPFGQCLLLQCRNLKTESTSTFYQLTFLKPLPTMSMCLVKHRSAIFATLPR